MSGSRYPPVGFVGAGRLARTLAVGLRDSGFPVVAVAARTQRSAARLARRLALRRPAADVMAVADTAKVICLAVPDGEIEAVARGLARDRDNLTGRTVLHHSGVLGPAPLRALERRGAQVGVLHPLQSLNSPKLGPELLRGCFARIEGSPAAVTIARRMARALGMRRLDFPTAMTPAQRELYHAAASIAANDLIALLSLATPLLVRAGLPERQAEAALLPLMRGALRQAEALGPAAAVTGPVVRGDADTLRKHLRRLRGSAADAHRMLSRQLVELVKRAGSLEPDRVAALERLLDGDD